MRLIRNIGVLFIVTLLILATGGVSVYHHVCHCAGEISASVFIEAACEYDEDAPSCCSAEEIESCCTEKNENASRHTCHDENCCQNEVQFVKISDSFHPGIEKVLEKPCFVATAFVFIDLNEDTPLLPSSKSYSADLPPPDTGRQILISLHQLKLDTHLV